MALAIEEWVEGYRVAWEAADADAAAALFTPDASYRSYILEEPHEGTSGIHGYWSLVTSDKSDVRVRMGRPFVDGSRVAVEFWTTMRNDDGDQTLGGCLLLDFTDEGLCRRLREYWHFVPGTFEPPPEWGE